MENLESFNNNVNNSEEKADDKMSNRNWKPEKGVAVLWVNASKYFNPDSYEYIPSPPYIDLECDYV